MKKKYTKKQILEAIAYWEKQLKMLDESSSDGDWKCVAITQIIMAYKKGKIKIDPEYLLDRVYEIASSLASYELAFAIRDEILNGKTR